MWRGGITHRPRCWIGRQRPADYRCSRRATCCNAAMSQDARGQQMSTFSDHAGSAYSIREMTVTWMMSCKVVAGVSRARSMTRIACPLGLTACPSISFTSPLSFSRHFLLFHSAVSLFSKRELTFTFAICYRRSVCLSSVCRLSVTLVRPTQPVEIFGNFSSPSGTLAMRWHSLKILLRSSQGNPSVGGFKGKRGSKI